MGDKQMSMTATRMELSRHKKRLKSSEEAHKMLKDKQDDLMRRFVQLLKDATELRSQINQSLKVFTAQAGLSVSSFSNSMVKNLFLVKETLISADIKEKNWMGVAVVDIEYEVKDLRPSSALISSPLLSRTESDMRELLKPLERMTEAEKNCQILANEIESLRRRVNALEHMIIPGLRKTIRVIKMKLSDGERETITRLIKVKTMK